MTEYLPPDRVLALVEEAGDSFFTVAFIKRTDGTARQMTCRRHVSKGVKGVTPPGQRREQDLSNACLTVYEVPTGAFKRIPLDSVLYIKSKGQEYYA